MYAKRRANVTAANIFFFDLIFFFRNHLNLTEYNPITRKSKNHSRVIRKFIWFKNEKRRGRSKNEKQRKEI